VVLVSRTLKTAERAEQIQNLALRYSALSAFSAVKRNRLGRRAWIVATALLVLGVVMTSACAGSPASATPQPTPTDAPRITCPAAVVAQSPNGLPLAVTYPSPTVAGGTAPVTTACTPASQSTFPVGVQTVACTATDAARRTDSCTFTITVVAPPKIAVTRFLAFGDSITAGEDGIVGASATFSSRRIVDKPYPALLQGLLAARYTSQTITVDNRGVPGERVDPGAARLSGLLASRAYDVVLLLEGANDLFVDGPAAVGGIVSAARFMANDARSRGVQPFVATFPPQRASGSLGGRASLVPGLNVGIRAMAQAQGFPVVDLEAAFGSDISQLIGPDGLHPTAQGYSLTAATFFDALKLALERPPAATFAPAVHPARR
jgi:lysophospholipase L1-like esterase